MMRVKSLIVCLVALISTVAVAGETKVFQLSLTPDVAIYPKTQVIEGITLSIWGENPQTSLALGFVNGCTGESIGASFGLVNYADSYKGAQFSFFNKDDVLNGVQFGTINYTEQTKIGFQFGLVNVISENKEWFADFPHSLAPVMIFINWRLED